MLSLDELSVKHLTDKGSLRHHYCGLYEELFAPLKDKPINLLEVGVQFGFSLRMWREWFTSSGTTITGFDWVDNGVKADGCDIYILNAYEPGWVIEPQDILIDDGSHDPMDQASFVREYWRFLKPGGYLIVEDILKRETTEQLAALLPPTFQYTVYDFTSYAPDGLLFVAQRDWFKPKRKRACT
jgi:hypothetical protein